jgi:ketosteroid isomerase-like protein
MKRLLLFLFLFAVTVASAQKSDEAKIRRILVAQTEAWNKGDIKSFMTGYWKSDSLMFTGKNGVTRGWQNTLRNYEINYPDTATMGKLSFDLLTVKKLSAEYFFVVGKWMLKRTVGDLSGHYNLLFRKIKGEWVIIADHSS